MSPLSVRRLPDGPVEIRRTGVPLPDSAVVLVVPAAAWREFLAGIKDGEFDLDKEAEAPR